MNRPSTSIAELNTEIVEASAVSWINLHWWFNFTYIFIHGFYWIFIGFHGFSKDLLGEFISQSQAFSKKHWCSSQARASKEADLEAGEECQGVLWLTGKPWGKPWILWHLFFGGIFTNQLQKDDASATEEMHHGSDISVARHSPKWCQIWNRHGSQTCCLSCCVTLSVTPWTNAYIYIYIDIDICRYIDR